MGSPTITREGVEESLCCVRPARCGVVGSWRESPLPLTGACSAWWALTVGFSSPQKAACDDFLTAIKPFWKECPELTDHWCLKYLSVRNYNLEKAVPRCVLCLLGVGYPSSSADARGHRAYGTVCNNHRVVRFAHPSERALGGVERARAVAG